MTPSTIGHITSVVPKDAIRDMHYLQMAFVTAYARSKDPNTKVASVIVSSDERKIAFGYNGFPRGMKETPERWTRPEKYARVVHSETNALLNADFSTVGCTLYCTLQPCHECLSNIVNAGISRVVWYDSDRIPTDRQDIFKELLELVSHRVYAKVTIIDNLISLYQ